MHGVEHVNDIASSCLTYTIMVHAHAIPVLAVMSCHNIHIAIMFCSWDELCEFKGHLSERPRKVGGACNMTHTAHTD